jgi:hypothetical protein
LWLVGLVLRQSIECAVSAIDGVEVDFRFEGHVWHSFFDAVVAASYE